MAVQLKKKYPWTKEADGTFTIFNVEVFMTHDDEMGCVTPDVGARIVQNFKRSIDAGHLHRVHEGHHAKGVENRPAAGFLDNLRFDGEFFWADLAEIPPGIFSKIQRKTLPFRSVEYDDKKEKIETLALLESRPPHFELPALVPADEPVQMLSAYQRKISDMRKERKLKFFMKKKYQSDEPEKKEDPAPPEKENSSPDTPKGEGDEGGDMASQIKELKDLVLALCSKLHGDSGNQAPAKPYMDQEPAAMAGQYQKPTAPGNQQKSELGQVLAELKTMGSRIESLEKSRNGESLEMALSQVCQNNPTLDYQQCMESMKQFQDDRARLTFVETLAKKKLYQQSEHPMTRYVKSFTHVPAKDALSKYQKEDPEIQEVARRAYQDYQDTASQKNRGYADDFIRQWGKTPDRLIEAAVQAEKDLPGSYDDMFFANHQGG